MLFIFLTVLSCTALKLSDPVALRDITDTEDNQSLQAWCAGTGCVMPFTPASCLSWCDWNVDKQADAEARGAFGNGAWKKKQVKPDTYNIQLWQTEVNAGGAGKQSVKCHAATTRVYYFMAADADDIGSNKKDCGKDCAGKGAETAIFPGGDMEVKFSETYLACNKCYKIGSGKTAAAKDVDKFNDAGLLTHFYIKFVEGANAAALPVMQMYDASALACGGTLLWDPTMEAAQTGGAGTVKTTNADGTMKTPTRDACDADAILVAKTGGLKVGANAGDDNGNKALVRQYGISFSGTSVGGVVAPKACKAP